MSAESNIILVANDNNVINILKPKLVLLREIDNIHITSYSDALKNIEHTFPEIILIHCSNEKTECLELIKKIKTTPRTKNASVLLFIEKYDQDFILNAYDADIADYLKLDADNAEILMRTLWCLKKNANMTIINKQHRLLEKLGAIDKNTGFYTNTYCEKIFENEFDNLKKINSEGILMLVSPGEESKTKLNPLILAKAIKDSTRTSDIVVHGNANRFYVLLSDTQLKGAFCVWDKIKKSLGEHYTIIASISSVEGKKFKTLQNELLNALIEAESLNRDLIIVNEKEKSFSAEWLEKINSTQKNFKLFKQAFNKKLEKVIAPVFFQMQKLYEEKLFETQIEQYSNSTLSVFILKNEKNISELKITYPGFSKINIDLIHQGLDSPENQRISLDLTDIDEAELTKILEDFILEFKTSANV